MHRRPFALMASRAQDGRPSQNLRSVRATTGLRASVALRTRRPKPLILLRPPKSSGLLLVPTCSFHLATHGLRARMSSWGSWGKKTTNGKNFSWSGWGLSWNWMLDFKTYGGLEVIKWNFLILILVLWLNCQRRQFGPVSVRVFLPLGYAATRNLERKNEGPLAPSLRSCIVNDQMAWLCWLALWAGELI